MSGIDQTVMLAVSRVRMTFESPSGRPQLGWGTGFWIRTDPGQPALVTNRHNMDPRLLFDNEDLRLAKFEVELRRKEGKSFFPQTKFLQVTNLDATFHHRTADVSLLASPRFAEEDGDYGFPEIIRQSDLADQPFFADKVAAMDIASFIGFPGKRGRGWWDQLWNMPIARVAYIASWPTIPFTHHDLKTTDVTLVSGFSFSGSSGSPVILHQKGIRTAPGFDNPAYVGPRVIGIMSGHWNEPSHEPEMLRHTGLSYFTRSTAILQLLLPQDGAKPDPPHASAS